jgi:sugar phosphate isomerase/epimerase
MRVYGSKIFFVYDVKRHIQVHVPFYYLFEGYLSVFIKEKINPEISFSSLELDSFQQEDFGKIADALLGAGLSITLHAPFMDLRPGAVDARIRQATEDRLRQVFDIAPLFHPKSIVCHPSFDRRYYVSNEEAWLKNSLDTWKIFLPVAKELNTIIALENVYETEPGILKSLIDALASPHFRICFDTGHFNVFARSSLEEWIDSLGFCIAQLHLHDNHARDDEHLPVGGGTFPFRNLFSMLGKLELKPIVTVEPHTEENLQKTLKNIHQLGLLEFIFNTP